MTRTETASELHRLDRVTVATIAAATAVMLYIALVQIAVAIVR
jgi:hypothetical protein